MSTDGCWWINCPCNSYIFVPIIYQYINKRKQHFLYYVYTHTNLDSFSTYEWLEVHHGDFAKRQPHSQGCSVPFWTINISRCSIETSTQYSNTKAYNLIFMFFFQFSNVACVLTAMVKCIFCIFSGPPFLTFPGPASLNSQFERFEERDLEGVRQPPKRRFPAKQRLWYPQITCSCTPHLEVGWWYFWMCFSGYFLLSTM